MTRQLSSQSDLLAQFGISAEPLRDAIRAGEVGRQGCVRNHPAIFPPIVAWAETCKHLAENLVLVGLVGAWYKIEIDNVPLVVNDELGIEIAVATADAATGNPQKDPRTNPKGPAAETAVEENKEHLQLSLPLPRDDDIKVEADPGTGRLRWYLLFHRAKKEIRCELSLPVGRGKEGRLEKWYLRYFLDSIEIPGPSQGPTDPNLGPEINVPVVPR